MRIRYRVGNAWAAMGPQFSAPVQASVGRYPYRIAAADLNADGMPDLATADNGSPGCSRLLGRGNGSFRKRVAYYVTRGPADIQRPQRR